MNRVLVADWRRIEAIRAPEPRVGYAARISIPYNQCHPTQHFIAELRPTIPIKMLIGTLAGQQEIITWIHEVMGKALALACDRQIMHAPQSSFAVTAAHLAQLQSVIAEAKRLYPECIPLSISAARPDAMTEPRPLVGEQE